MADVKRIVLVEQSAARMFELVDRVEDYPQFLPWCGGTEVLERSDSLTVATLHINYHGVRAHFTTANTKQVPHTMLIALRDGPFRQLEGAWRFSALGEQACKIEFHLHYEFSSRLLEKIVGPVFGHVANTFVDAFVKRAEALSRGMS
jgi:ribosome-associated toxin RatA of RatAB toxin-antitoxin module